MADSKHKSTEIGVKVDPRLMAEVDLRPRIYGTWYIDLKATAKIDVQNKRLFLMNNWNPNCSTSANFIFVLCIFTANKLILGGRKDVWSFY